MGVVDSWWRSGCLLVNLLFFKNTGDAVKNKVEVVITLDDAGHIGVRSSTQNLVTIFGMFELAKKAYIENSLKPKSEIVAPFGMMSHN